MIYEPNKKRQRIELPMLQYEEILLLANKYHELSEELMSVFDKDDKTQFISIDVNKLIQTAKKELTGTLEENGLYIDAEFMEVRK